MRFNTIIDFHRINMKIKTERINSDINKSDDFKNSEKKIEKSNQTVKSIVEKIITTERYENCSVNFNWN